MIKHEEVPASRALAVRVFRQLSESGGIATQAEL